MAQPQPEKTLAGLLGQYVVAEKSRVAFLNARISTADLYNVLAGTKKLHCEQKDRSGYLDLLRAGFDAQPKLQPDKTGYDICLIIAGKFRQQNEQMIKRATSFVRKNGVIIVAGAKNTGISSLLKRTAVTMEVEERFNKFHSTAFSIHNSAGLPSGGFKLNETGVSSPKRTYRTEAGLFSAGKIDQGSALLAEHFDNRIGGSVADLGAGWGYLSGEAIDRVNDLKSVDLYEADWQGVELCKYNLNDNARKTDIRFHWHDVATEPILGRFDCVIMNPPFHQGGDTSLMLGQKFIETASKILVPNGSLLMVANRHLAYEKTLGNCFRYFSTLEETAEFKIILAKK